MDEKISTKLDNWINNNLDYFNPTIYRKNIESDLQIKSFIELIFMKNMFYPKKIYSLNLDNNINLLVKNVSGKMDFNSYFQFDNFLIAGSECIIEYNSNIKDSEKINFDKKRFSFLVENGLDVFPRRSPYRQLDVKYSLDKIGIKSNYSSIEEIYGETILSKDFNPLYLSEDLAYSITHTIFYITDMGRKTKKYYDSNKIIKILKSLIYYYILKNNIDILAECLICLNFMSNGNNDKYNELIDTAFKKIKDNIFNDDSIIAPGENFKTLNKKNKEELFFSNYHTTLVVMGASYIYGK